MVEDFTQKMAIHLIIQYMLKSGSMFTNEFCHGGDPLKERKRSLSDEEKLSEENIGLLEGLALFDHWISVGQSAGKGGVGGEDQTSCPAELPASDRRSSGNIWCIHH